MTTLAFTSPTAAAAFILVDLLAEHCRADTTRRPDGSWEVHVALDKAPRSTVPATLATAAEWLDECGLSATTVTLNGDTYLLPRSEDTAPTSDDPVPSGALPAA